MLHRGQRVAPLLAVLIASVPMMPTRHAKADATADTDLFGDEIVQPIEVGPRRIILTRPAKPAAKPPASDGMVHVLTLHSGAELHGELLELTKSFILWKRPDLSEPLRFPRDAVKRIALARGTVVSDEIPGESLAEPEKPAAATLATVKLPGGDWLHGTVSSADGKVFSVSPTKGTSFSVPRDAIAWLYYSRQPVPAFAFADENTIFAGWSPDGGSPVITNENGKVKLKSRSWLGRSMTPPPRFEVSIDIPEQAANSQTRMWLQPFSPSPNSYSTGTVELSFGNKELGRLIYINQFKRETTPLPADNSGGAARYRVFYDGIDDRLIVLRNGKRVGDWPLRPKDEDEKNFRQTIRRPKSICIDRGYSNESLEISGFKVLPWSGAPPETDEQPRTDSRLTNEEATKNGTIESAGPGELMFAGEKVVTTPGTFVEFPAPGIAPAKPDALLVFGALGELGVAGLEIRNGRALGRTSVAPLDAALADLETIILQPRDPVKPAAKELLVFRNGDILRGALLSAREGGAIRWKTEAGQEVGIEAGRIAGVRLAGSEAARASQAATVELRNGDRLRGTIVQFDAKTLLLKHDLLGERAIASSALWSLFPSPKLSIADAGDAPAAWLGMRGAGQGLIRAVVRSDESAGDGLPFREQYYLDGSFLMKPSQLNYSTPLQWTADKVPERFEVRVMATDSMGGDPYVNVSLSGPNGTPSVQISAAYGQIRIYAHNTVNRRNAFQNNREISIADKLPAHFSRRELRLFVDSITGTIDLMLDGVSVGKFGQQAAERAPGIGAQVSISCYASNGSQIVLSDVSLRPWNGEVPRPNGQGALFLANGDTTNGTLGELKDGKLHITSDVGPLEVPFERVHGVQFGGVADPVKTAARLRLTDGSVLNVDAYSFEGGKLTGRSSVLGDINLEAIQVAELIVNPHPKRFPKLADPKPPRKDEEKKNEAVDG